jgi:hypothetical protein
MINNLTINIKGTEQKIMEVLLNSSSSGEDVTIPFVFYAMGVRMHIDKFTYYYNLLEEAK